MNKSNLILKHSTRQLFNVIRRMGPRTKSARGLLLNSLPKSGTHLLHPLLLSLGLRDYQGFFASTPPVSMKVRDQAKARMAVQHIMANELFSAHMFFDSTVEQVLIETRTPSIFIYRDPRAVFVSELNYVQHMNRWHKYHGVLGGLDSEDEAFQILLHGLPDADFFFPSFKERVSPYVGWIQSDSTFALTFEDLIDADPHPICEELLSYLTGADDRFVEDSDTPSQVAMLAKQLESKSSHTYTGLDPDRWQYQLNKTQRTMLEEELGDLMVFMGYSS